INGIKPTICADRVYLKVMTNHGVSGWGEIKGVFPKVAKSLCEEMFSLLDGQNPTRIEHIWQILYRAHRNHRGGPFMVHCIAGIDAALWDITGKLYGVPVYRLLGGPTRDKLRVYPAEGRQAGSKPAPARRGSDRHRPSGGAGSLHA
ncbi:MAG: D-galactonate dehydratase, partial [Planctomycetes bacterium]|nr:D-galactonate dehydratase [Planctomycetota bacterium]